MIVKTERTVCDRCHKDIVQEGKPFSLKFDVGLVVVNLPHVCRACLTVCEHYAAHILPLAKERKPRTKKPPAEPTTLSLPLTLEAT